MEGRGPGKDLARDATPLDSEALIAGELPHLGSPELRSDGQVPQREPSPRQHLDNEAVQKLFSELDTWSFDIFQVADDYLPKMVEKVFKELGLFDAFPLDIKKVRSFTLAMVARYQPNPYHNFRHACDVLHAVYLILTITEAGKKFTHLEKFALALAALCHDVDHPGLTNAFLVATYDPLALRYNDRGVLENHHAATSFITMRGHDALNLLSSLNEVEQKHMRKLMLIIILATDMESHSRILREMVERLARPEPFEPSPPYTPPGSLSPLREEFNSFASTPPGSPLREQLTSVEEGPKGELGDTGERKETFVKVYKNPLQSAPPITSSNDVLLLLQMIIKCADLSNVVKPFFLSKRWAALLLLEWFRQGEIEKQLGLPISKFMDREDPTTLMAMTCGCIDYIAKPMYEATAKLLPKLQEEVLMNLSFNRQMWTQFSTNGRRASETAQQILGPFAPPPIPKGITSEEAVGGTPGRLEGKLVATFNGHYVAADLQSSEKRSTKPQTEPMPSVPETISADVAPADPPIVQPSAFVSADEPEKPEADAVSSASSKWEDDVVDLEKPEDVAHSERPQDEACSKPTENEAHSQKSEDEAHTEKLEDIAESAIPEPYVGHVEKPLEDVAKFERPMEEVAKSERSNVEVATSERPVEDAEKSERSKEDAEISERPKEDVEISEIPEEDASHSEESVEQDQHQKSEVDVASPAAPSLTDMMLSSARTSLSSVEEEPVPESDSEPEPEFSSSSMSEAPLSLLFGSPISEEPLMLLGKSGKGTEQVSLVPGLLPSANLLIVDRNKKSIDAMAFRVPANLSAPTSARSPSFRSGVVDADAEKGKIVVPQPQTKVGFWDAIRTHPRVARFNRALDSNVWNSVFIVATLFALFADDVVKGFLPKQADIYESHVLTACLVLFLLEAVILSIFRGGYFLSFFFWLDLLGSLTLVPLIIGISSQNLVLARTGRAAKTITRASKLLQASHIQAQIAKFFPVVRFLKFVGQYKDSSLVDPEYEEGEEHVSSKPSQLWTRLSELTIQKLILGVLVVIILYPYFGTNEKDLGPIVSLDGLDYYLLTTAEFNQSFNRLLVINDNHGYDMEYLGVKETCLSPPDSTVAGCSGIDLSGDYDQLLPDPHVVPDGRREAQTKFRVSELISVTSDSSRAQAYYSVKKRSKAKYSMNIGMTIIILAILATWCFFLSRDSNHLLIQPIERMVQFVKELAEDPVSFAGKTITRPTGDKSKVMETFFVEAALVKIASLTKVALGDAGMDILSVNLKGAEFNPMLPGKKVRACFGFCDIRNFTDATECLQEDVMMFVNRIADVVHNKVVLHSGFPNKNIGDAFLIVWKKTVSDNTNKSRATSFADRALRSFLDIIQCIETSQSLAEFAKHPAIQKRMPGYRIHMGFGLHVGWAIEGAIGSAHKVDPSYLSPHVNMASRLEAATKQYGVMLLISETVIAHLTKSSLRDSCRKLDRVTVKGSHEPLVLYTFDIPLFQQDLRGNPAEYRDIFEEAVDNYIDGEWATSLEKLEECSSLWPTDKPVQVLLKFMASHNYTVPADWQGYRELTEK